MKLKVYFTATRIVETEGPEEGQSKEDFLREWEESVIEDPFSFIDQTDTAGTCKVEEVLE